MRLDKFITEAGVGRRKIVRKYIEEGKVTVNDKVIIEPAIEVNENIDVIRYLGQVIQYTEKKYYMLNKPGGYITAKSDKIHKTVFDLLEEDMKGLFHVGRLDKDTEGLLLLTNDGEFEHKLMSPDKHIDKKYYFWALGSLNRNDIKNIEAGVYINNKTIKTKPAKIEIYKQGKYSEFKDEFNIDSLNAYDNKSYDQKVVSGCLTIREGKKHQVKKMLKEVGCHVVYLKRLAIGGLFLDDSLGKGEYRQLTESEIKSTLYNYIY